MPWEITHISVDAFFNNVVVRRVNSSLVLIIEEPKGQNYQHLKKNMYKITVTRDDSIGVFFEEDKN